jgi:hypothetical protein
MLFRAVALSLALMIGIGTIIPLATEYAEAGPKHTKRYKKKPRKYKKYSKGWWRQYHARMKRKKGLAMARKRALRLQQLRLAKLQKSGDSKDKGSRETRGRTAADGCRFLRANPRRKAGKPQSFRVARSYFRSTDRAAAQSGRHRSRSSVRRQAKAC